MNSAVMEKADWRDSLHALIDLKGFSFVLSERIARASGQLMQDASAEKSLRASALAGNVVAMEQLGARLLTKSPSARIEGEDWLRRSARAGNPVAMHYLAEYLLAGGSTAQLVEARALFQSAVAARFNPSKVTLAALILQGVFTEESMDAVMMLRDAAASGSRLAHVVLAVCHLSGCGMSVDREIGIGWLRRLGATTPALIGGLAGYLYAGALHLVGTERRRHSHYAAILFVESIRFGNLDDEVNLAYLIRRGEVLSDGMPSLDELLLRHVAAGASHALMNQALRLAFGNSCGIDWRAADDLVKRIEDYETLLSWWAPLAAERDPEGHLVLGWLARHGKCSDPEGLALEARLDLARANQIPAPDWLYMRDAANQ